jgi:hypothetical protein
LIQLAKATTISLITSIDRCSRPPTEVARSEIGLSPSLSTDWKSAHSVAIEFLDTTAVDVEELAARLVGPWPPADQEVAEPEGSQFCTTGRLSRAGFFC